MGRNQLRLRTNYLNWAAGFFRRPRIVAIFLSVLMLAAAIWYVGIVLPKARMASIGSGEFAELFEKIYDFDDSGRFGFVRYKQALSRFPPGLAVCQLGARDVAAEKSLTLLLEVLQRHAGFELDRVIASRAQDCPENAMFFVFFHHGGRGTVYNAHKSVFERFFSDFENNGTRVASESEKYAAYASAKIMSDGQRSGYFIQINLAPKLDPKFRGMYINDVVQEEIFPALVFAPDLEFPMPDGSKRSPSQIVEYHPPSANPHEVDYELYAQNNATNICEFDLILLSALYEADASFLTDHGQKAPRRTDVLSYVRDNYAELERRARQTIEDPKFASLFPNPC